MIKTKSQRFALACMVGVATAVAQTPNIQDLQNKLLQFEESSQKTIAELKAQIAALQGGHTAMSAVPPSPVAPQTSEVPVVQFPVEYYGTETRTRKTAAENEVGAPRIDNEPLDPQLRGVFGIPGTTSTYMQLGGFVKTDLLYDLNYAGTYYAAYVASS